MFFIRERERGREREGEWGCGGAKKCLSSNEEEPKQQKILKNNKKRKNNGRFYCPVILKLSRYFLFYQTLQTSGQLGVLTSLIKKKAN